MRSKRNKISCLFKRDDLSQSQLTELEASVLRPEGRIEEKVMKPTSLEFTSEAAFSLIDKHLEKKPKPININFFLNALNGMHPEGKGNCIVPKTAIASEKFYEIDGHVFYELTFEGIEVDTAIANKLKSFDIDEEDKKISQSKITYRLTKDGQYEFVKLECAPKFAPALEEYFYYSENKKIASDTLSQAETLTVHELVGLRKYLDQNLLRLAKDFFQNKDQATSGEKREFFKKVIEDLPSDKIKQIIQNTCALVENSGLQARKTLKHETELELKNKNKSDEVIGRILSEMDIKPVGVEKLADEVAKLLPVDENKLTMNQRVNFYLLFSCLTESVREIQNTNKDKEVAEVVELMYSSISSQSAPLYLMYERVAYKTRDLLVENKIKDGSVLEMVPIILKNTRNTILSSFTSSNRKTNQVAQQTVSEIYEEEVKQKICDDDIASELKCIHETESKIESLLSPRSSADSDVETHSQTSDSGEIKSRSPREELRFGNNSSTEEESEEEKVNQDQIVIQPLEDDKPWVQPKSGVFDNDQIPVSNYEYNFDMDDDSEFENTSIQFVKKESVVDKQVREIRNTIENSKVLNDLDNLIVGFYENSLTNLNGMNYGELSNLLKSVHDNKKNVEDLLLKNCDDDQFCKSLANYQLSFIKQQELIETTITDRLLQSKALVDQKYKSLRDQNSLAKELKDSIQAGLVRSYSEKKKLEINDIQDFCSNEEENRRETEIKQIQQDVKNTLDEFAVLTGDKDLSQSFERHIKQILENVSAINAEVEAYKKSIADLNQLNADVNQFNKVNKILVSLSRKKKRLEQIQVDHVRVTPVSIYLDSLSDEEKVSEQKRLNDIKDFCSEKEKNQRDIVIKQIEQDVKKAEVEVASWGNLGNDKNIQPVMTEILTSIKDIKEQVATKKNKLSKIENLSEDINETNLIQGKVEKYLQDIQQQYDDCATMIRFVIGRSESINSYKINLKDGANLLSLEAEKSKILQDYNRQENNIKILNREVEKLKVIQKKLSLNSLLVQLTFSSKNKPSLPKSIQTRIENSLSFFNDGINILLPKTNNFISSLKTKLQEPKELIKEIQVKIDEIKLREPYNLKYNNFMDVRGDILNKLKTLILNNDNFKQLKSYVHIKGIKTPIINHLELKIQNANNFQEIMDSLNNKYLRRNSGTGAYGLFKRYDSTSDKYITKLLEELTLQIKKDYRIDVVLDTYKKYQIFGTSSASFSSIKGR